MEFKDIMAALQSGRPLTKEQVDYLVGAFSKTSAGKTPEDVGKSMTAAELEVELTKALDAVRATPEGQAQIQASIADRKEQRFIKKYTPFFSAVLSGADIVTSLNQIRQSKEGLSKLTRPEYANVPGIDPLINQEIGKAQRGTLDAARAIQPAKQELQDQYAKDIALAKSIGGGQSSTLGALGQVASLRRARGAGQLVPMMDSIRAREEGRLDNLLALRSNLVNQQFGQRFANSRLAFDQYNQDAAALGGLGAAGRSNLRNSMQSLLGAAPGVLARLPKFGDRYSAYEDQLNGSLTGNPRSSNRDSGLTIDDSPHLYYNF